MKGKGRIEMKLKPDDLLDKYDLAYKKRDEYIINVLNKEIDKVKEKQLFLRLPVVMSSKPFDKSASIIFEKDGDCLEYSFELSKAIFETLERSGYKLKFTKLNYLSGRLDNGYVDICWDKYYEKTDPLDILRDPVSVKSFYKKYNAIAESYINEIIEPKMRQVAEKRTYITLPIQTIIGDSDEKLSFRKISIIFNKEYSQSSINVELTNEIIKILKDNGFSCELDLNNNCLKIRWFSPYSPSINVKFMFSYAFERMN